MDLTLHLITPELLDAMCTDPEAALQGLATIDPEFCDWLREMSAGSRQYFESIDAVPPWVGYLAIDCSSHMVVGTCGFKGNPSDAGFVEIAYGTLKRYEGKGFATAMAQQLTGIALNYPEVTQIIAHTLSERNASCRVLEKAGYELVGEVEDPEDGTVWQWRYRQ